jgi:hypothetical protein
MRIVVPVSGVTIGLASAFVHGAQQQASMGQDLAATIALHGLPCNKVIESKRNGDSDYVATCQDGNRYHIFVDKQGRVVVQKL